MPRAHPEQIGEELGAWRGRPAGRALLTADRAFCPSGWGWACPRTQPGTRGLLEGCVAAVPPATSPRPSWGFGRRAGCTVGKGGGSVS